MENNKTLKIKQFTLPAQYAGSVDLKGGLMNIRVCTVKFLVVESYLLLSLLMDALGHQPEWTWRLGDLDFMRRYFSA